MGIYACRTKSQIGRIKLLLAVFIVSACMQSQTLRAEEDASRTIDLGPIVVTANRFSQQASDVASSVTVIDKKDIESSPREKIDDILRPAAGLDVNYHYGMHIVSGVRPVNLRGTASYGERTLVLVDGAPLNNPLNGWVDWSRLPREAIARIEVVRGPSSALYGSNGMGGTINIITKKPRQPHTTFFEQKYGSMDTWTTKLVQEGRANNLSYYFSGGYEETIGYISAQPQNAWDIKGFSKENKEFAKLAYDISEDTSLAAGFSRYYAKRGAGRAFLYGTSKENLGWLDWDSRVGKTGYKLQFYVNDVRWSDYYDASAPYSYLYHNEIIRTLGWGANIQANIKFTQQNIFTVGIDTKQNSFNRDDKFFVRAKSAGAKGRQFFISPFINEELKFFSERLILNLGMRYDRIEGYSGRNNDSNPAPYRAYSNDFSSKVWEEFSPKLGLVYHLNKKATLKSSVGKGFRAPSLYELYVTQLHGPLYLECNPELSPEKILSYDFGAEYLFLDSLWARFTFYQSYAKDFIGFNSITKTYRKSDNIGRVNIRGFESELEYKINARWECFVNYTYNNSEIRKYASDQTVVGNYLAYAPHQNLGSGITYSNPRLLDARVLLNYKDTRYANNQNTSKLGSYYTVDLGIARQLGKYCKLSLSVENLFDNEYTLYVGTSADTVAPGRVVSVSLDIKL